MPVCSLKTRPRWLWEAKTQVVGNLEEGRIGVAQEVFGQGDLLMKDVLIHGNSLCFLKQGREVVWVDIHSGGHILHGQTFMQMQRDIVPSGDIKIVNTFS